MKPTETDTGWSLTWKTFVSDIAMFVLKRDVKLQLANLENLEKTGNCIVVREKSGKMRKRQGNHNQFLQARKGKHTEMEF